MKNTFIVIDIGGIGRFIKGCFLFVLGLIILASRLTLLALGWVWSNKFKLAALGLLGWFVSMVFIDLFNYMEYGTVPYSGLSFTESFFDKYTPWLADTL